MPKDPRQRNFWQLLAKYRRQIPGQTYDYVFSIVSAAVIGENPRLFGFQGGERAKRVSHASGAGILGPRERACRGAGRSPPE